MYTSEIQKTLDVLNEYKTVENIKKFNILHLYPESEPAYPNGYYDSRFFTLVAYNTVTMQKEDLGRHDGLTISPKATVKIIRIFVDGSTFVRFYDEQEFSSFQDVYIGNRG